METFFIDVYDDGAYGTKLVIQDQKIPTNCPGMGGWKQHGEAYFTRVKGEIGSQILRVFGHAGFGEITMDGNQIVGMESYK